MIKVTEFSKSAIMISIIMTLLPFIANYLGGVMLGFPPSQYFDDVLIAIFIVLFNGINVIAGVIIFNNLRGRKISIFTSLIPAILGAATIFFFHFHIDIGSHDQATTIIATVQISSVLSFIIPWAIIHIISAGNNMTKVSDSLKNPIIIFMLIVMTLLPFAANYLGGIMLGFSPFLYFSNALGIIFIVLINGINVVAGVMSFSHLRWRRKSILTSLIPAILGSAVIFYIHFNIDTSSDAQAAIATAMAPFFAIPFFIVPWLIISHFRSKKQVETAERQ